MTDDGQTKGAERLLRIVAGGRSLIHAVRRQAAARSPLAWSVADRAPWQRVRVRITADAVRPRPRGGPRSFAHAVAHDPLWRRSPFSRASHVTPRTHLDENTPRVRAAAGAERLDPGGRGATPPRAAEPSSATQLLDALLDHAEKSSRVLGALFQLGRRVRGGVLPEDHGGSPRGPAPHG